jgi:hypothetical protein
MEPSAQSEGVEPMDVDMEIANATLAPDKAPTIPLADWEKHKEEIYRIYVVEKRSFNHLTKVMEGKGFTAT